MKLNKPKHNIQNELLNKSGNLKQWRQKSCSGFKIGDVIYESDRKKTFCGITKVKFEQDWVNHSSIGDIYLPKFCALIHKLRRELLRQPFDKFNEMAFPRLLSLDAAKRLGLVDAWPYILLSVQAFKQSEDARALDKCPGIVLLDPLQCSPAYVWLVNQELRPNVLPIRIREELGGWSYRNERRKALSPVLKAVEFLRNEYVFLGTHNEIRSIRMELIQSFCQFLDEYELHYRVTAGTGCFENEKDELSRRLKSTKKIVDIPILDVELFLPEDRTWLEVFGSCLWESRFTEAFGIRCRDCILESGCVGVGISRLGYGILAQVGDSVLTSCDINDK